GRIGSHRFFHENVLALSDSLLKVNGTEARRCSKDDNIGQWNCFLVCIEADELGVFRYGDFCTYVPFLATGQGVVGGVEPVAEGVSPRYQFYILFCRESLHGRTRTSSAASNDGNLDGVVNRVEVARIGYQWHRHDTPRQHCTLLHEVSA